MNKQSLLEQLQEWQDNSENEKIIAAVLMLPEEVLDAEIMYFLVMAYVGVGEQKKALAVMEGLRATEENTFFWQFNMSVALYKTAKDDEECLNDPVLRKKSSITRRSALPVQ